MPSEASRPLAADPIATPPASAYQAFLETASERRAIAQSALGAMNIDVGHSVVTTLGALPAILAMRPQLIRLPDFRATSIDRLELYALALQCAHGLFQSAREPHASLPATVARGILLRDKFLSTAETLARWKLFPAERLAGMRNGIGHQSVGEDLIALGSWFQAYWETIGNQCPATEADVAEALAVGEKILSLIGLRGAQPLSDAALERRRAFALLDSAYDEVRKAVTFCRWEQGDANRIAPSFRAHPRTGKKKTPAAVPAPAAPPTDIVVVPSRIVAPETASPHEPIEGTTDKPVPSSELFSSETNTPTQPPGRASIKPRTPSD